MGLFSRFSLIPQGAAKGPPMSERPTVYDLNPGINPGAAEAAGLSKRGLFGGWSTPDADGITKWDRVALMGASLRDDPQAADSAMAMLKYRQAQALVRQKQAAQQQLAGLFQQPSTAPIAAIGDFAGDAPKAVPQRSLRDMAPQLAQAKAMGVDIGDYVTLADKITPNVEVYNGVAYDPKATAAGSRVGVNLQNVNGFMVDNQDPTNANRFLPEAPVKGVQPYAAPNGGIGWAMSPGTLDAIASTKGAESGADAKARAPYQINSFPGAGAGGGPRYMTTQRFMQDGGVMDGPAPADVGAATDTAKIATGQYEGILKSGQSAVSRISTYRQLGRLIGDLDGGKLTPAGLELSSALNSLGFKMDPKWSNAEAAEALTKQLVLDNNGGSLGTGFSNADRDFITGTVPGLAMSQAGRSELLKIGVAKAERDQLVAGMARKWVQQAGRLDKPDRYGKTFFDYMDEYAAQHPVWAQ